MNGNTQLFERGQKVGPYGNIYLEEAGENNSHKRLAKFICPFCNKEYIATVTTIKSGRQKGCSECGRKRTEQARRLDLTGQIFGYLTALYPLKERKNGNIVWHCKCKCGNETDVRATELKNGYVKSCGCYSSEVITRRNTMDITGQRFGKLTAIKNTGILDSKSGCFLWEFKCDCGNDKIIPCGWVTSGNTTSCGCSKSKGETKVCNILNNINIAFIQQYSFNDCRNKEGTRKLYFDFFLPDYNILLEYDGEQHFSANGRAWNTEDNLIKTQNRDKIKNDYCLQKQIPLIRIAYSNYDALDDSYIQRLIETATQKGGIIRG